MLNIGPFINLGWHTVPLKGELKRLEDGSKTLPKFEKEWRVKYTEKANTIQSKLGGAITGEVSGIIAIDCDNDVTYELFKTLDPGYDFVFMSKGKSDKVCGTFIYKYDSEIEDTFHINNDHLALDVYSNSGFVYLPTLANETKVPFEGKLPKLKEMPLAVKVLLTQLKKQPAPVAPLSTNTFTAMCLAP